MAGGHSQEVLVRYLSDSLRMVEEAMRGGPTRSASMQQASKASTSAQHGAHPTKAMPSRRASSDVQAGFTGARTYSSTQHHKHSREAEAQQKLRQSMQAQPSTSKAGPGPGGVRWSSTGRGMGGDTGRAGVRPGTGSYGGVPATQHSKLSSSQGAPHSFQRPDNQRSSRVGQDRAGLGSRQADSGKPPVPPQSPMRQPLTRSTLPTTPVVRGPSSDAGSNADWWRPPSSSSVISYPMTAVTDRGGSIASTEFRTWMERINQLENAVKDERSKRRQFEEEVKKICTDSVFNVSRGDLSTGTAAGPGATAAGRAPAATRGR